MLKGALGVGVGGNASSQAQKVRKGHGPAGDATEEGEREMLEFSFLWTPHLLSVPLVNPSK